MKSAPEKQITSGHNFLWNLARRNIRYYLRENILFGAGCAVSAIVLSGALLVGTSLKFSLRELHQYRLGKIEYVLSSQSGYFRESLADSIANSLSVKAAPILPLIGSIGVIGKNERVHRVNIIGVDERFWELGPKGAARSNTDSGITSDTNGIFAVVNAALAEKLSVTVGDYIALRFQTAKPHATEAPFGWRENSSTITLQTSSIVDKWDFGDFSLKAEHFTVYNVFVSLKSLQSIGNILQMTPMILIGDVADKFAIKSPPITKERIINALQKSINIKDVGLNIRAVSAMQNKNPERQDTDFEIYSDRIFISEHLKSFIVGAIPNAIPVSTWFVNSIDRLNYSTPYSFVSTPPISYHLKDDDIALNKWTADDLNAKVGDTVTMAYFVLRPNSSLRTDTSTFVVSAIIDDADLWLNRSLMPPYPGLSDAGGCADWDPSIPVDLKKIRPKDEDYWERRSGTPKAVISAKKAAEIWDNRFGVWGAIRVNSPGGADDINTAIASSLTPTICGLQLTDIREVVHAAVNNGINFAPLFIGLSFFALAAPLLLIWLLSSLQIKSRASEHRLLLWLGYSRKHILTIYLLEGLIVFSISTPIGLFISPLYTLALISALRSIWRSAAQVSELSLHVNIPSVIIGSVAAFVCALTAMLIPILSLTKNTERRTSERFTSACSRPFNKRRFVVLNILREKRRVLGEVAILASALLILGTTQFFHKRALIDPTVNTSGTGGFTYYGELNSGVLYEETGAGILQERGIDIGNGNLTNISFPIRVKDGDDASCLNLNQTESPTILGVNPQILDSIGAFSFASLIKLADKEHPWQILNSSTGSDKTVFGIADANTIEWGLKKSIGDTLTYIDELGETLNIILAAGLKNSILQGKIIIAESNFIRHYPTICGYRLLLLAPPIGKEKIVVDAFLSYHDKNGLNLESTIKRLSAFNAVENTYLSIFSLLGMMGLILGCAGMGIAVMRNIEERRYELAVLLAQGFNINAIKRLLFAEHAIIALAGTGVGLFPAVIISGAISGWAIDLTGLLRIVCLLAIVLFCGIGSIALMLMNLRSDDLLDTLKNEIE